MNNIQNMERKLPVAPLKIAALKSCEDLAKKVDDYIVSFRQNSLTDLDRNLYSTYEFLSDRYLLPTFWFWRSKRCHQ